MTMRLTGGLQGGRRLSSLKGLKIRPTSDKVRAAVFNVIGQDLTGIHVLDLFAGTGALGLEALSRGAAEAVFIDLSNQSVKLVRKNLLLCGYESRGRILKRDLRAGLPWKGPSPKKFDLVFIDPPYGSNLIPPVLRELVDRKCLAAYSKVVAESAESDLLPETVNDLRKTDSRLYGETRIDIYSYGE